MEWSPQQKDALTQIAAWFKRATVDGAKYDSDDEMRRTAPIFRLFGYAGTGKTTIAKELRTMITTGEVRFATFTGKAALVLHNKGCTGASTIHRMIYRSFDKSKDRYEAVKLEVATLKAAPSDDAQEKLRQLERELLALQEELKQPGFTLNINAFTQAWDEEAECFRYVTPPALIVIDECSMVDQKMGSDLASFGIPILVLGDPAQLPPISNTGGGYFTGTKNNPIRPDFLLTEIHRQAEGSPIIDMATQVRNGEYNLRMGAWGDSVVANKFDITADTYLAADQILCGRNDTRKAWNQRFRTRLGFEGFLPNVGEKLICLRNNHDAGLLNGSLWKVITATDFPNQEFFSLEVESLDEPGKVVKTRAHKCYFQGEEPETWQQASDFDSFDFGYVITVHKAQGSQWDHVLIMDESAVFRSDRKEWLYTAITRAAQRVTVATSRS